MAEVTSSANPSDQPGSATPGDQPSPSNGEPTTADQTRSELGLDDNAEPTPDPTGATPEQMAAKEAANILGDQDAVNLAGPALPETALVLNAQNLRRYPWLFEQTVADLQADDPMTDEERDAHNQAVEDHWRSMGVEPVESDSDFATSSF